MAELEIGRRVLELAQRADQSSTRKDVTTHVGYLIDDGLPQLERLLAFHPSISEQAARLIRVTCGTTRWQRTDVVSVKQLRREIDACVHLIMQESPQTLTDWSGSLVT